MSELQKAASMSDTLRSTMCSLVLLSWHLIITFFVGSEQPDVALCHRLLAPLVTNYPRGAIILFMRARLCIVTGSIEHAIHYFNESISAQDIYRQFHHVCFWELMFAHCYLRQWSRAANYAKRLMDESRWSRAVYTYLMAIVINADETAPKRVDTVAYLLAKVPSLRVRIAGKSIPVEKFCVVKANRFLRVGTLHFAHYEFVYMWGGFNLLTGKYVAPIRDDLDRHWKSISSDGDVDDECLYLLLRAACLRCLQSPLQAEQCLTRILNLESQLTEHRYLVPYATFELATLRIADGRRAEAEVLLDKARAYTGYPLLSRLHFRIHSATEMLGARTPMSPV